MPISSGGRLAIRTKRVSGGISDVIFIVDRFRSFMSVSIWMIDVFRFF